MIVSDEPRSSTSASTPNRIVFNERAPLLAGVALKSINQTDALQHERLFWLRRPWLLFRAIQLLLLFQSWCVDRSIYLVCVGEGRFEFVDSSRRNENQFRFVAMLIIFLPNEESDWCDACRLCC